MNRFVICTGGESPPVFMVRFHAAAPPSCVAVVCRILLHYYNVITIYRFNAEC